MTARQTHTVATRSSVAAQLERISLTSKAVARATLTAQTYLWLVLVVQLQAEAIPVAVEQWLVRPAELVASSPLAPILRLVETMHPARQEVAAGAALFTVARIHGTATTAETVKARTVAQVAQQVILETIRAVQMPVLTLTPDRPGPAIQAAAAVLAVARRSGLARSVAAVVAALVRAQVKASAARAAKAR